MAVVTVFSSRWQNGVYLIGHDQYSADPTWHMVTVKFGCYSETGPIRDIAHARDKFGPFWALPVDAVPAVDGTVVDDDYELSDDETLTFHRVETTRVFRGMP